MNITSFRQWRIAEGFGDIKNSLDDNINGKPNVDNSKIHDSSGYKPKVTVTADDIAKRNTAIADVESGKVKLTSNAQKGNYGEMKMDQYFESQGYQRISGDPVTDLNAKGHQGIDGVYYNPNGNPKYIVGEAKYNTSKLGNTADGKQMSTDWINGSDRLENAVGKDTAGVMGETGYGRQVVRVMPDGSIKVTTLS